MDGDDLWLSLAEPLAADPRIHDAQRRNSTAADKDASGTQMALDSLFSASLPAPIELTESAMATGAGAGAGVDTDISMGQARLAGSASPANLAAGDDLPLMLAAAAAAGPSSFPPLDPTVLATSSVSNMDDVDYWQFIHSDLVSDLVSPDALQMSRATSSKTSADASASVQVKAEPAMANAQTPSSLSGGDAFAGSFLSNPMLAAAAAAFYTPDVQGSTSNGGTMPWFSASTPTPTAMPTSVAMPALVTSPSTAAADGKKKAGRRGRKKREPYPATLPASQLQPLMPMPMPIQPAPMMSQQLVAVKPEPNDDQKTVELMTAAELPSSVPTVSAKASPAPEAASAIVDASVSSTLAALSLPKQPLPPAMSASPSVAGTPAPDAPMGDESQAMYDKRQQRLIKNRAAALLSRKRKREHLALLEQQTDNLKQDNEELLQRVAALESRAAAAELQRDEAQRALAELREELARYQVDREREQACMRLRAITVASSASSSDDEDDVMELDREETRKMVQRDYELRTVKPKTAGMVFMMIIFSFALFSLPVSRIALPLRSSSGDQAVRASTVFSGPPPLSTPVPESRKLQTELRDADSDDEDTDSKMIMASRSRGSGSDVRPQRHPTAAISAARPALLRRRSTGPRPVDMSSIIASTTITATTDRVAHGKDVAPLENDASAAQDLYQWLIRQHTSAESATFRPSGKDASTTMSIDDTPLSPRVMSASVLGNAFRPHAQLICDNLKRFVPPVLPPTSDAWRPMEDLQEDLTTNGEAQGNAYMTLASSIAAGATATDRSAENDSSSRARRRPRLSFLSPLDPAPASPASSSLPSSPPSMELELALAAGDAPSQETADVSSSEPDLRRYLRIDVEVLSSHLVAELPKH
ncbi:hypothetical protein THASP1DRAFT_30945 [Thamnocephalis sphaerospora]|uniref:BZIP domain-containing protein n=1 Tax=Thamnocephalis sphaerospora TaxID=78915 RepID=A0A4P9XP88_9FUNG|nr:hypothetical protein THASP1DRAFT_30945 [Thamnocephalis sphaerospora]|eukprot:RKP07241.1 hypothetical protein THASP1DRAFT_30945 [Thamnocephalis sphaerospora]